MKRIMMAVLFLVIFCVVSGAEEQGFKVEKKEGKTDLKLPVPVKVMQKGVMHARMGVVNELLRGIAKNDLRGVSEIASVKLGSGGKNDELCSMVMRAAGEKEYEKYSRDFQDRVEKLADVAKRGDREKSLEALADVMTGCNNCHDRFYATALEKNPDIPYIANCRVCHENLKR